MAVVSVDPAGWIIALFMRDDGERFLLGSGAYEFLQNQQHFAANSFENDVVEMQGSDGVLLAGQVRRATSQVFDGFVGDGTTIRSKVEEYREAFLGFFLKNHFYTVVYVFADGTAIKRQRGFIVDAPEVKELWQKSPQYHVALNFEDVNYYQYDEDSDGQEIYGKTASVKEGSAITGGLIWDAVGVVFDAVGAEFEAGSGGPTNVTAGSIDSVYPVLEITGPAQNPIVENITTGQSIAFAGNVTASQKLTIDTLNKTATLNGTSVISKIVGDWLYLSAGQNKISYSTDNAGTPDLVIKWQEIVG